MCNSMRALIITHCIIIVVGSFLLLLLVFLPFFFLLRNFPSQKNKNNNFDQHQKAMSTSGVHETGHVYSITYIPSR